MRPFALLVTSAVLLPLVSAAPVPKAAKKVPIYFPTVVGTKWEMKSDQYSILYRITEVEEEGEEVRVSVEFELERLPKMKERWIASKDGLIRENASGKPVKQLEFPLISGARWTEQEANRSGVTTILKVTKEKVAVPVGEFEALRVEKRTSWGNSHDTDVSWWVPEYGMVKNNVDGREFVMESFEKGKK